MSIFEQADADAARHMASHRAFIALITDTFGTDIGPDTVRLSYQYCLLSALTDGKLTTEDLRPYLTRILNAIFNEIAKN